MEEQSKIISGFYLDQQLSNPLLVASLHPNTVRRMTEIDGKKKEEWVKVGDPEADTSEEELKDKSGGFSYSKKPICSCLIPEDFQVSIANNWSEFGDDPIGEAWRALRPFAPYIDELKKSTDEIVDKTANYVSENGEDGSGFMTLLKPISHFLQKAKDSGLMEKGSDYLNRALITKATRFSYYGGTGVDFGGNLMMKFTLFFSYDPLRKVFRTVQEQVDEILPYVVGDFKPVTELDNDLAQKYASWQLPPGGFKSELGDIDNICKGTLKLHIGGYYAVEDLVISSAQFNFSKVMAKIPGDSSKMSDKYKGEYYTPLYCDVALNLKPASRYSINSLIRFVSGKASQNKRTEIALKMKESLENVQ